MVMWHKINNGIILQSVYRLPDSEQLPNGSWVTGFAGADPETIFEAGWVSSAIPSDKPFDGYSYTLKWTLIGNVITSEWVKGELLEDSSEETDSVLNQKIQEAANILAGVSDVATFAELKDIVLATAQKLGEAGG